MTTQPGNLILEGKDPLTHAVHIVDEPVHTGVYTGTECTLKIALNSSLGRVPFEELLYYAVLQRKKEDELERAYLAASSSKTPILGGLFNRKESPRGDSPTEETSTEKTVEEKRPSSVTVSDEERVQASRAIRTASWLSIFYLITTE